MTRVGIFGAAGYGGVDMIRLLVNHPQAEITYLAGHTTVGEKFSDLYPFMLGTCDLPIEETSVEIAAEKADVLAFALPAGAGTEMMIPQDRNELGGANSAEDSARRSFAETFGQISEQTVSRNLNVQPTLEIRPGYQFNVLVDQDVIFPGAYQR